MPDHPVNLPGLERTRAALYGELAREGDFRRGSLNAMHRNAVTCSVSSPEWTCAPKGWNPARKPRAAGWRPPSTPRTRDGVAVDARRICERALRR